MRTQLEALVVHSDPERSRYIADLIGAYFPWIRLELHHEPDVPCSFDLFFVEAHEWRGAPAAQLAPGFRTQRPDALIVAVSEAADAVTVEHLGRCGCDLVWDRGEIGDEWRIVRAVRQFVERRSITVDPHSAGPRLRFRLAS